MNTFLLILFVIFAAIFLFVYLNGQKKYASSVSVLVDAPLEHSFKVAMNNDHMKEWLSSSQMSFESIENLSGEEKDVGSQYKLTFMERRKRKMEIHQTVTDYVENEHFGFDLDDKMFNFHIDMKFNEEDGKTRITEYQSGGGKNMISNAMLSIFKGQSTRIKQTMYDALKMIIEREHQE